MSTLNDEARDNVVDRQKFESVMWQFQAGNINLLEMVGFGLYGRYAIELLHSKDGYPIRFGEKAKTQIPFYLTSLNFQAETDNVSYLHGTTEKVKDSSGKTVVKGKEIDKVLDSIELMTYAPGKPMSDTGNWKAVWRLAVALHLNAVTWNRALQLCKNKDMLKFATKHWQTLNPFELRALWQKEYDNAETQPEVTEAKPVKAKEKPTVKKAVGQDNAMKAALSKAGLVVENGK